MRADLARLGDRLFGRGIRLQLAAWLFEHREEAHFTAFGMARETGTDYRYLLTELNRLAELDMVERLPFTRRSEGYRFTFKDSPRWAIIETAIRSEAQLASPGSLSGESNADRVSVSVMNPHRGKARTLPA